ncbi:hypothetical protein AB0M43_22020 [Longispora sp. NPDC051575]|uniref:hypothetical protein n=1 Tax=Longispora sp. NPDC051575 TaxID=3154943 RepID=UPI00341FC25F
MTGWEAWRQDDNGNRYRIGVFDDRVAALARTLELESGTPHKQLYWVSGPPGPTVPDRAAARDRGVAAAREAGCAAARYRSALVLVGKTVAGPPELDLDTVAAVFVAAARVATPTGEVSAGKASAGEGCAGEGCAAEWLARATAAWSGAAPVSRGEFAQLTGPDQSGLAD